MKSIILLSLLSLGVAYAWVRPTNVPPMHPIVPKASEMNLSEEDWAQIRKMNTFTPGATPAERFPGYKKGTQYFGDQCGVKGPDNKITGGHETAPHEYPWMAGILLTMNGKQYFCGGTLISNKFILTAAHCADKVTKMEVILGAHEIKNDGETTQYKVAAENWFIHPDWNPVTVHNDVALVQLPEPIEFDDNIRPICLPSFSDQANDFANLHCPATGWGKPTDSASSISEVLREVETETISNLKCFVELPTITKGNICISGHGGNSTCNGDSGGPLHYVMEDSRLKQIGITSFGLSFGCELGLHAAFARVTYYLEFIETVSDVIIDP